MVSNEIIGKALRRPSQVNEIMAATVPTNPVTTRNSGLSTRNSQAELEKSALVSSWVYSNVDVISKLVSQTPMGVWKILEGEEAKPIANHPFEMLLRNPNPFMGSAFFKRYLVMWLMLRGEAYIMLVPDATGELVELWPLPSDKLEPVPDPKDYIKGYMYKVDEPGKKDKFIPAQYICYIRLPNPFDFHRGLSPISAYKIALEVDGYAVKWNKETFTSEAVLRTLISVPPNISRSQFAKIKDEIVEELMVKNRRYMVARGGQLSVEQLGLNHKDMEYLRGREFTREEIDRVYGFPAGFWAKEATEANSRTARETLVELAIWPVLVLIGEEMKSQIIDRYYSPPDDSFALEVRATDIRARNVELDTTQAEFDYQTKTINEVRNLQGETPFDSAYGDIPYPLRDKEDFVVAYLMARGQFPQGNYPGIVLPEYPLLAEIESPPEDGQERIDPVPDESGLLTDLVLDERFTQAKAADIQTWQKLSVKMMRQGKALKLDFGSDSLAEDEREEIAEALAKATTIAEIKRVFSYAKDWVSESDEILFSDFVKKKR